MQFFAKFKHILRREFRATLNFRLKLKLRVFLAGQTVAMVTYCAAKLTATWAPIIGQFVDMMILASTGLE